MTEDGFEDVTMVAVNYFVKYIGKDTPDIKNGKVYKCILEWYDEENKLDSLSVIDETKEDYIYFPSDFEKVE